MAINYASKYSSLVDERFKTGALTAGILNNNYDWLGVETVVVYGIPTSELNDYTLTGASRYGTPAELQNTKQELTVAQDRAFTFTIDKKSEQDTVGVMQAGAALRREIDEVVIPEVDTYRIATLASGAKSGHVIEDTAVAKDNAYEKFLTGQGLLDDAKVPQGGRFALITPAFYNMLKLSADFIKKGDMAQTIAINGVVGEVDGVYIIKAPASYFPAKVHCIITNNMVMPSPVKLNEYKIHQDPPGINGWLVEGRIRYDAFILNNKADAIAVIKNPAS